MLLGPLLRLLTTEDVHVSSDSNKVLLVVAAWKTSVAVLCCCMLLLQVSHADFSPNKLKLTTSQTSAAFDGNY